MFGAKPKPKLSHPHDPEITRIYNSLIPKPAELVSAPDRRFIREGDLTVYDRERSSKHKVCHFFLFNDVMLQTSKESSKKWKLEIFINLRFGLQVGDVPDSTYKIPNVEFRLYTRQKTVFLFAICEEDKNLWLSDLKQCINGSIDERFPELPKHPQNEHSASPSASTQAYASSYYGDDAHHEPERLSSSGDEHDHELHAMRPTINFNSQPPSNQEYQVLSYPPIPPPGQYSFQHVGQRNDDFDQFASRAVNSNPFASQSNSTFTPDQIWDPTLASEFAQPFVSSTFVPQTTARFDSVSVPETASSNPFLSEPTSQVPPPITPIFDPTTDPNNPFN